ncbi:MAG: hypothetical protein KKC68_07125 [Candidatus Thermoplasmatota archaeon]|nr:hypothetical protein [Candidatus Thermoplasmatota archaeon]MBU1941532.1 hypothetical protein [Candidatus Thermoplasmatota archaeon]
MNPTIGIRREDKNKWERRVPITPKLVQELKEHHSITTHIQPSSIRVFTDEKYQYTGAIITEDLSDASIIFAVKEIPTNFFQEKKTYIFFSHTIKGQQNNMPMLKHMMDLECTLLDYERIIDSQGRRLVFFGRYAGLAGMIDTLWGYGQRLQNQGISSPLTTIQQTIHYGTLENVKEQFHHLANHIKTQGLSSEEHPLIIGFAGYGHVSQGAQEIIDLLPHKEIQPKDLPTITQHADPHHVYKVVFKEHDIVTPKQGPFNLQDYYKRPDRYEPQFDQYLPHLSILMNCIYWDNRYPRLVTKDWITHHATSDRKLQIIGDISVDIHGAIECTEKVTTPDSPCFVYHPLKKTIVDGPIGHGIAVMAIDNLPCELPRASSIAFSKALFNLIPPLAHTDFTQPLSSLHLPTELKPAIILHQGNLTKEYQYIDKYL